MTWNDTAIDMLKRLWDARWTASMIAGALNRQFGTEITANSVVGKVHRLKLPGRPSPIKRGVTPKPRGQNGRPRGVTAPKPKPAANVQPRVVPSVPKRPTFSESYREQRTSAGTWDGKPVRQGAVERGQCRWIVGNERGGCDALMCGAPVSRETIHPFCREHTERTRGRRLGEFTAGFDPEKRGGEA